MFCLIHVNIFATDINSIHHSIYKRLFMCYGMTVKMFSLWSSTPCPHTNEEAVIKFDVENETKSILWHFKRMHLLSRLLFCFQGEMLIVFYSPLKPKRHLNPTIKMRYVFWGETKNIGWGFCHLRFLYHITILPQKRGAQLGCFSSAFYIMWLTFCLAYALPARLK